MHNERPDRFDALARHLPFAVDDYDAVRERYVRWRAAGADADREAVEVWTYCYVLRYFYARFAAERTAGASDLDMAIARAFKRIFRSLEKVRDPERYPQFVSVVCKRVLLSHRERRRDVTAVGEWDAPVAPEAAGAYDRSLVRDVLARAVGRLPASVREVARLRLLEGRSYEEVAEATGHPVPTTRTYVSRALGHLRKDPDVLALQDPFQGALDGEEPAEPSHGVRHDTHLGLAPQSPRRPRA